MLTITSDHTLTPWNVILRYRKVLLAGALLGIVIGVGIGLRRPILYTSSTTLIFPSVPTGAMAALNGQDLPGIPILDGAMLVPQPGTSAATAGVILQSRETELQIIEKLQLQQAWRLCSQAATLKRFKDRAIFKTGKSGKLTLGFRDANPDLALQVTTAMLDQLRERSKDLGFNPAEQSVQVLDGQVDKARTELQQARENLLAFQKANNIVSLPDEVKSLASEYAEARSAVEKADVEATVAGRKAEELEKSVHSLITSAIDPQSGAGGLLNDLYQQAGKLEGELAAMREHLTSEHPDVQEKEKALAELKKQINQETSRQLALLNSSSTPAVNLAVAEAIVARARANGLHASLNRMNERLAVMPEREHTFATLSAEVDAKLNAFTLFHTERQKAEVIAKTRDSRFIVVDAPAKALEADPRGRALILLVCLLVCLLVAGFFPLRDWVNQQSIRTPAPARELAPA